MPVEAMVPALCRVVEQALVAVTRGGDHFFQALAGKIGAFDGGIGLVDIGLVVLAVVVGQRFRRHGRLERGVVVRQVDQLKCHEWIPFSVFVLNFRFALTTHGQARGCIAARKNGAMAFIPHQSRPRSGDRQGSA